MKFGITATSGSVDEIDGVYEENGFDYIDIDTLEELIKFMEYIDEEIIMSKHKDIEIYNDWRE